MSRQESTGQGPRRIDRITEDEKAESGNVKLGVFIAYMKAVGLKMTLIIILFFVLYQASSVLSNIWLSAWTEDPLLNNISLANTTEYAQQTDLRLGVYGAFGVGQAVFVMLYAIISSLAMVAAAKGLHDGLCHNILRSPMSFFDTTPSGRIVNRFSKDVDTVDNVLPGTFRSFITTFFNVLSTLIVISYSTPLFLIVIVPLVLLYYFIQRFYIPTSRQLKRIESTTRSPIYTHFGESGVASMKSRRGWFWCIEFASTSSFLNLPGILRCASTIRAYGQQARFMQESERRVDENNIFYFGGFTSNRWLGFRLELIGNLVVLSATLFAILGRDSLEAGLVGLSVSYALQVTGSLNWMVRMTSELETNIVSVERIKEYTETPQEASWECGEVRPPADWPQSGAVNFQDFCFRYRPGLELVLKGISAEVRGGEKIGIVGRTGAGKSSLTVALFRLAEAAGGRIAVDDMNINRLGLHELRRNITILPQDPVLFSGSLRMNLDPFDEYSEDEIWRALEHAHLKRFVRGLSEGIEYEVGEGGQNLSVGQRQLVCLARTLMRKTKILVLDEATAAVDLETDDLIQSTIRVQFKECTVLTIAHRLNTIMDNDRILVLDNGLIREFDSPQTLLADKSTIFYGMCKDANLVS